MNKALISAIVCTYNRGLHISETIDSLLKQSLHRSLYEIIVVDNASADDTASIIKKYEDKGVRYIYESNQGLSYSRNTGFQHSSGDIVAYIDDDAVASFEWLERIVNAFSISEEIVAAGGRIIPIWEIEKPDWITPNLYTYFSCIDWSDKPFYLETGRYLFGCNMAFRKKLLQECGGFSTKLGRIGNNLLSIEEWEVFKYIDKKELKKYYDPDIYVEHTVLKNRITWKWLKSRLYWQGVSNLYYDYFFEGLSKTALYKKYSHEMKAFFSGELKKIVLGKGDIILLRLFMSRYFGTILHFLKISAGMIKQ